MNFREYLNSKHDFLIIDVNQNKRQLPYPFMTFQIIDEDRTSGVSSTSSKLIKETDEVVETITKKIECIAQLDAYGDSYEQIDLIIQELVAGCDFVYNEEIWEAGFSIINISSITDLSSLETTKTRYRKMVEITYEYNAQYSRTVQNANSIEFGTDDNPNSEKVGR